MLTMNNAPASTTDSRPSSRRSNSSVTQSGHEGRFIQPPPTINFNGQTVAIGTPSASPLHSPFPLLRGDPGPSTAPHRSPYATTHSLSAMSSPATPLWPELPTTGCAGAARARSMSDRTMLPPSGTDRHSHSFSSGLGASKGKERLLVEGMVADQVVQLQSDLREVVELTKLYASSTSEHNALAAPPDVLLRLTTLATLIHRSLRSLQPQVQQSLHPAYKLRSPPKRTRTAAERDMETIRVRRDALIAKAATSAAVGSVIQEISEPEPKTKGSQEWYPLHRAGLGPGKCHSCGTSDTIHWRAGPDGPDSLCDTCGVHYAKLTRNGLILSPSEMAPAHDPLAYLAQYHPNG